MRPEAANPELAALIGIADRPAAIAAAPSIVRRCP
jgi:hypothetical protein